MSKNIPLRPAPNLRVTATQDGIVILDVKHGMCFPLDTVGTVIWRRLDEGVATDEIGQQIAQSYQIPFEQASRDVTEFTRQLQQNHLLVPESHGLGYAREADDVGPLHRLWRRTKAYFRSGDLR